MDSVGPHGIVWFGAGGSRNEQAANLAERGAGHVKKDAIYIEGWQKDKDRAAYEGKRNPLTMRESTAWQDRRNAARFSPSRRMMPDRMTSSIP